MAGNNELSEREIEILSLVASGRSNKEIARKLYISPNTVKVHLRNIFAKIEVSSRTEATLYAVRAGLVEGVAEVGSNREELPGATATQAKPASLAWGADAAQAWRRRPWLLATPIVVLVLLGVGLTRWLFSPTNPSPASISAPGNTEWEVRADLPVARFGHSAAVYENQIIVIGGETTEGIIGTTDVYNPETDRWSTLSEKPTAVADIQAAVLGGKIYVPGGRTVSGESTNVLEIFDPQKNVWEQGAPLPVAVSAYALTAFEGQLYLFGGWDGSAYYDMVLTFDPNLEKWDEIATLPGPRAFANAVAVNDKIFVLGGFNGLQALDANLIFRPDRAQGDETPWEQAAPLPAGLYGMGAVYVGNSIYVLGGVQNPEPSTTQWIFQPDSNEWIIQNEGPEEIVFHWSRNAIAIVGAKVHAFGGILNGSPTAQNLAFQAFYTVPLPVIIKP